MHKVFNKLISLLLIISFLFMGCAHTPKIMKPASTDDKAAWLEYYQDQFKAKGSKVLVPEENAPDAQKAAYKEARASWNRRRTTSYIISGVALVLGISVFVSTLSEASEVSQ